MKFNMKQIKNVLMQDSRLIHNVRFLNLVTRGIYETFKTFKTLITHVQKSFYPSNIFSGG